MKFLLTKSDLAFEISQINVLATGKIEILVKAKNPYLNIASLETLEYSLDGAVWVDCTTEAIQEIDFNSLPLTGKYSDYRIIWNAARDLGVDTELATVQIRIALNDRINLSGEISEIKIKAIPLVDFTPADPTIFVRPLANTDDPVFQFQTVVTLVESRIHFKLTISENENFSAPVAEIESSADQANWTVDEDPLSSDGCTGHEPHLVRYDGIAGLTLGKNYYFKVEEIATHYFLEDADGFFLVGSDNKLLTSY